MSVVNYALSAYLTEGLACLEINVVVEDHQEEGNDKKVVQHQGWEDVDDPGWLHGEGAVGHINV